jgi:hypothetical protein
MPKLANWVALAVVFAVALSPLCEIFDKTDEWSEEGSDFILYIICLFCFLGFSLRRSGLAIARVAAIWSSFLPMGLPLSPDRSVDDACSEPRGLFLTFCDLRI